MRDHQVNPLRSLLGCLAILTAGAGLPVDAQQSDGTAPNVLLVVADDMGWSDLGVTGGEIDTPNIDALAARGLTMTNFHVAPTCSPTRSMLMTGLTNHEAGVGTQRGQETPNQVGHTNYAGELHDGVVTVAEALKSVGYQTMMAGKWHIGYSQDQQPHARGFDHSFALLEGGGSHFADKAPLNPKEDVTYLSDGAPVELDPEFYSTIDYSDQVLSYLDNRDRDRPFFAYLAYTAPHDPLHVPDDWVDRYRGEYDAGPDAVRSARLEKLRELGLLGDAQTASEVLRAPRLLPSYKVAWDDREADEKVKDARAMEIYAAMITLMDQQLGRVLDYLAAEGELENTVIFFMSDNGASPATPMAYPGVTKEWLQQNFNHDVAQIGQPGSYPHQGLEWAQVSNAPYSLFKAVPSEGGTRAPLIVAGPNVPTLGYVDNLAHVTDIVPTVFNLAGLDPSQSQLYADKPQPWGQPLQSNWAGEPRAPIVTELFGNRSIQDSEWKLRQLQPPLGTGGWELFDLTTDPGETTDVAAANPEIVDWLNEVYESHAEKVGIIDPDPIIRRSSRATYAGDCNALCEARFRLVDALLDPKERWLVVGLSLTVLLMVIVSLLRYRRRT